MMTMHEVVLDVQKNWVLYASMPFVAAAIGYVTKIIAIWMMFNPIEWFGLDTKIAGFKVFGWQGIIPRRAAFMATTAMDLMINNLLKPQEILDRLDARRVAQEIQGPMLASIEQITEEVATRYQPGLWEAIPDALKQTIIRRVQADAPQIVETMMNDIKANMESVIDLKDMVVTNLVKDVRLLNRMFMDIGHSEFRFIRNSGLFFGFAIGCVQASTWALTHNSWVMPLFGGFTGWFTDWLALKMIFVPKQPKKYFGLVTWHGLFQKRRKEVAADYGRLIAREIVTPAKLFEALLKGPLSDRLFARVQKIVQKVIDEQAGLAKPLVVFAVGSTKYQAMKRDVSERVFAMLPEQFKHVEKYATDAMDVENTLVTRMQLLNEDQFEGLIRPAFQQDEWILITVGAVLGFMVGEMQVFLMLHVGAH